MEVPGNKAGNRREVMGVVFQGKGDREMGMVIEGGIKRELGIIGRDGEERRGGDDGGERTRGGSDGQRMHSPEERSAANEAQI